MKKLLLVAGLVSASFLSQAQLKFGVQLGGNIANQTAKSSYATEKASSIFGFTIGGFVKVPIAKSISFVPGLNFTQKGSKTPIADYDVYGDLYSYDIKTTLNYLEIPLNVAYDLELGGGSLSFNAGPSISIGLSGTEKETGLLGISTGASSAVVFDGSSSATDGKTHLKRLDLGFGLGASYKFGFGMFAGVGYNAGLSNIAPANEFGYSVRNNGFRINVGYMFGGK